MCGTLRAFDVSEYPVRYQFNPDSGLRNGPVGGLKVLGALRAAAERRAFSWAYDASEGRRREVSRVENPSGDESLVVMKWGRFRHAFAFRRLTTEPPHCSLPPSI